MCGVQIELVLESALSSDRDVPLQENSEQRYFRCFPQSPANLRATVELCEGISPFALESLRDKALSLPF